jgi:hypothetical protein
MSKSYNYYRHIDGSLYAHVSNFGPFIVLVEANNLNGPRYHIGADFLKFYKREELH